MITTFERFNENTQNKKTNDIMSLMSKWDKNKLIETYKELFGQSPESDKTDDIKKTIKTKFIELRASNKIGAIKKYFTEELDMDTIKENANNEHDLIDSIENDIMTIGENIANHFNGTVVSDWADKDLENHYDPSIWIFINIPNGKYEELLDVFVTEVDKYEWSNDVDVDILGGEVEPEGISNEWCFSIGLEFMKKHEHEH